MQLCEFSVVIKLPIEIIFFKDFVGKKKKMSNTTKINFRQKQIVAEFMCEHTDLAKGVLPNTSQGKATANRLWENLAIKLNASGPPLKCAKVWRKVYADQKQLVKKKVTFNKYSKKKTGGGPFEEKYLSVAEEQILEEAGIDVAVTGLEHTRTFGSQSDDIQQCSSAQDTSTSKRRETNDFVCEVIDAVEYAESEETPKIAHPPYMPIKSKDPRETKTVLIKKNINAIDIYHAEVLKRLDKIIEIKEKKLEMNVQLHEAKMEIKKTELQIRIKELEKQQD